MKKILNTLGLALIVASLSGCSQHNHTFADVWSKDEANHWHAATCEHTEYTKDLAAHSYGDDNTCDVCGYVRQIPHEHTYSDKWSYDEANHWHAATCEHKDLTKDFERHIDADGDDYCDICGHFLNSGTYFFVVAFMDGENLLHDPMIVAMNESVYPPADPTKDGHDFKGWYKEPDFSGEPYDFSTPVTDNLTLFAKFEACEYKITYHNDQNIVHDDPSGYTYGVGVESFDGEAHDSTGKDRFYGWYFDEKLTKPAFSIPDTSMGDIDLYAKRSEIFHITYENWPEDIANPNPIEYTAYDEVIFDCSPIKGYPGFKNFALKDNDKTVDRIPLGSSGDKAITASYDLIKTKVTFDPNGGYLIPDQTYLYIDFGDGLETKKVNVPLDASGSTVNLYDQNVLEVPQKEGYCFGGYFLDEGFGTRLSEKESNALASGSTIYAKWDEIPDNYDGAIPASENYLASLESGRWEIVKDFNYAIPYYFGNIEISVTIFDPTVAGYAGSSGQQVTVKAVKENGDSDIWDEKSVTSDDLFPTADIDLTRSTDGYTAISISQKFYRMDGSSNTTANLYFNIKPAGENKYRAGNVCVTKTGEKYEEEYSYWDVPSIQAAKEGYALAGWFDGGGKKIDFANRWMYIDPEIKVKALWVESDE